MKGEVTQLFSGAVSAAPHATTGTSEGKALDERH